MKTGFIGIGAMGEPIALNMLRSGIPLVVWNRTAGKEEALLAAGAHVVDRAEQVFAVTNTVVLMLANEEAIDSVLQRGTPAFANLVRGHIIVQMGTVFVKRIVPTSFVCNRSQAKGLAVRLCASPASQAMR